MSMPTRPAADRFRGVLLWIGAVAAVAVVLLAILFIHGVTASRPGEIVAASVGFAGVVIGCATAAVAARRSRRAA